MNGDGEEGARFAPPAALLRDTRAPFTLIHLRDTPVPIKFTWARAAVAPLKVGVRKDVYALGDLIRFRAKADVMIPSGRFIYGFSAKDTLLNGRFSVNVPGRLFAYQKKLALPNGMVAAVSAGAQYVGGGGVLSLPSKFKPVFGVQLMFGGGGDGNIVYSGDGFSVKRRVPLPVGLLGLNYPKFDLETFATVKVPQMSSRFSVQNDGLGMGRPADSQSDELHLHVQGINAVIRL